MRPATRSLVSGLGGQPCVCGSNPPRRESAEKGVELLPLQPMGARGNSPEGWSVCRAGKGRFDLARSQNLPGCREKNHSVLVNRSSK